MKHKIVSVLMVVLLCAVGNTSGWAQSVAQISGTVTDQSGAILPGVEVTVTQTDTGLARTVITSETGSYVLPNLPVGPYRLEAALPGFRTFAQSGIVLTVGGNPTINVVLEVGQVSETVEVQADAALVETRSTGVGQLIDNTRVLELPLNARQVTELIILSGAAVGGGAQATPRTWPTDSISVGGGLQNGLTYILDGGTHNDPYSNLNLPLPFPDALQEFKVETSAVPAQYGQHSAGAVNAVTKAGTNEFHGSLFEFVRNKVFNAANGVTHVKDGLKRNQFGGVIGGPIVRNKLFFFGGYQMTLQRSEPASVTSYIPTPQMLAGDWTTFASNACQARPLTLRAPFVNNRISPSAFSPAALKLTTLMPTTTDPCGKLVFGRRENADETMTIGRIDYQWSEQHSLFGRYEGGTMETPNDYDGKNLLSLSIPDYVRNFHSIVVSDTYSLNPNTVNSFRATFFRTVNDKNLLRDFYNYTDLGVQGLYFPEGMRKFMRLTVSGGFSINMSSPGVTNSTNFQFVDDVSIIRGSHQFGIGANFIHANMNYISSTWTAGRMQFNASNTGHGLGDFMIGRPNSWQQDQIAAQYLRQNYAGAYIQDTWKVTPKLTMNYGVRWEPFFWPYDARAKSARFDRSWFDQGLRSTVFTNAPAGILFPGDPGVADVDTALNETRWMHFAPRLGLAWDPQGNGMTVIRAAYGIFFDYPHLNGFGGLRNSPPRGGIISISNPAGGFDNPWQSYPGGNPLPIPISKDVVFPTNAVYTVLPQDLNTTYVNQWNLSAQKQIGADWLVAANYVGNQTVHQFLGIEGNPAVFVPGTGNASGQCFLNGQQLNYTVAANAPCSTLQNTQARRVLNLADASKGRFFSNLVMVDGGGTRSFNGAVLSIQKRRTRGVTIQGNYTWSHCIDYGYSDVIQTAGSYTADRRPANRGNCELDRRHNFNMSTVYETPAFANTTLRIIGSGWRISGIVRMLSGSQLTISSGLDNALTGTGDQQVNQILASPYAATKTKDTWLNPAAFAQPATGTYGNMGRANVTGPGSIRIDMGVVRTFAVREGQSLEFRAEAFNAPNHLNPSNPITTFTDSNFGRIQSSGTERIMQMALKYVF
jgi:hypothetical protein